MESTVETKNMPTWFKEHAQQLLPMCLATLLFVLAIYGVQLFGQIYISDDEFGYFATSAFLRGLDWSDTVKYIPYYSYGYGMFILTPLSIIFKDPVMLYQAAIVTNGLMLVGCYLIARIMAKHLFGTVNWKTRDVICFLIMLYPANIVNSHIAWTEITLLFLFWLYVWISYSSLKTPSYIKYIGWAVVTLLLYVVHQRSLGILCATVLMLLIVFIINKEHRKYILSFMIVAGGLFLAHNWFKGYYQDTLYGEAMFLQVNDFGGRVESVTKEFSLTGIVRILQSFVGKWLYLMIGTGFLIWWAILALFKNSWKGIKSKFKNAKGGFSYRLTWEVLLSVCFVASFMLCVLANITIVKYDNLLYGRYNEYILGIYLLYGTIYFLKEKKWKIKFGIGFVLTVIAIAICQYVLDNANVNFYQCYHSVCTGLFFEPGVESEGRVIWFGLIGLVFVVIACVLAKGPKWKQYDYARNMVLFILPGLVWSYISGEIVTDKIIEGQMFNTTANAPLAEKILGLDLDYDIKYVCSDDNRDWVEIFQFLMPEKEIRIAFEINVDSDEASFYIVESLFLQQDIAQLYFDTIHQGPLFSIVVVKDGEIMKAIEQLAGGAE